MLVDAEDSGKALERAMRLLAVRARSRRELVDRLKRMGYSHGTIGSVERRLTDLGLIDDTEFALERVRHLLAKGISTRSARFDLQKCGLPEDAIAVALLEFESGETEQERALAVAQQRASSCRNLPSDQAFQRVARYLYSKGYGSDVAAEACSSVFGPLEND